MAVHRMDHVCLVVTDLDEAVRFFVELGLEVEGRATVEGDWVDGVNGLDGVRAEIVMVRTPDGSGRLELSRYLSPQAGPGDPLVPANAPGLRSVMFAVDDLRATVRRLQTIGAEPVGSIEEYAGAYRLCYVRGPAGVIVALAEQLASVAIDSHYQ